MKKMVMSGLKGTVLTIVALALLLGATAPWGFTYTEPLSSAREKSDVLRVGYIESESYPAFTHGLTGIAAGLEERGIISGFDADFDEADSYTVWKSMVNSDSSTIQFAEDMFFSIKSMGAEKAAMCLNSGEIDFLIAIGTVAGIFVSESETKNDFMVLGSANPILSGIVKSETERFKPNSYAYIDLSRYRRQVDIAHNIFGFTKLGVVYEDSAAAYAYSGIDQAELSAEAKGFVITARHVDEAQDESDMERYYSELKNAYAELIAEGIDALYITTATTEDHMLPWLLEDITSAGIPTISQVGESQVKNGVMLGITLEDPMDQGRFIADLLEQYLDGTPIDQLPQVYEIVPKIFYNYDAAISGGIRLSFKNLLSFDEIYRDRNGGNNE
ncbi:MAG: hypothetical protein FWH04_01910 [Oscillospiraceae bacterium]|nr:hypothetical protein [Oscillospiraceae bacterium]